jgi:DNA-binding transcriptional regulator YhcF (GntR family)
VFYYINTIAHGARGEPDLITFHVDRGDSVPAYAQLIRQVREALRMGLLHPGDQLPTVRSVVTSCTVNPTTVLKAYRELELAGLVEARQGSGTFVSGTLGEADPHVMARLRGGLARWLGQARQAGLEAEDVQALIASVIAEDAVGRAQPDQAARAALGNKGDAA